jgi:hypothetical protein
VAQREQAFTSTLNTETGTNNLKDYLVVTGEQMIRPLCMYLTGLILQTTTPTPTTHYISFRLHPVSYLSNLSQYNCSDIVTQGATWKSDDSHIAHSDTVQSQAHAPSTDALDAMQEPIDTQDAQTQDPQAAQSTDTTQQGEKKNETTHRSHSFMPLLYAFLLTFIYFCKRY